MTDYVSGLCHGLALVGLTYGLLLVLNVYFKMRKRAVEKGLLVACGGNKLLMETLVNAKARQHSDEERKLWREIAALGPYSVSFARPGHNPRLPDEVLYAAIAIKGLEYLVHSTDVAPEVLDGLIQTTIEMAMDRVASSTPKGDEAA